MLFQLDTFRVSNKPHAFDLNHASIDEIGIHVPAVWLMAKGDLRVTAYSGHIYSPMGATVAEFVPKAVTVAPFTEAEWDGERLWAPDMCWNEMVEKQSLLSHILDNLGEVPEGYTGWYSLDLDSDDSDLLSIISL